MSFSITGNSQPVGIATHYVEIGQRFCEEYYKMCNNNFHGLYLSYLPNTCFTFMNIECIGFNNYLSRLYQLNITKMTVHTVNVNVQPIGDTAMLINVAGTISVNDSIYTNKFTETLVVQLYEYGCMYITNSIFKLLD